MTGDRINKIAVLPHSPVEAANPKGDKLRDSTWAAKTSNIRPTTGHGGVSLLGDYTGTAEEILKGRAAAQECSPRRKAWVESDDLDPAPEGAKEDTL
jgi:hypothetical protein